MLRQLLLLAMMIVGLHTLRGHAGALGSAANAADTADGVEGAADRDLTEAAAELSHRAQAVDAALAQAGEALAVQPGDAAYAQLAEAMQRVPADEHALQSLWRVVKRRYAELRAEAVSGERDGL